MTNHLETWVDSRVGKLICHPYTVHEKNTDKEELKGEYN